MTHNQKDQERAFDEITSVIGRHRVPSLEDRDALPFVQALIQEVYRYHPVVPLVTHSNFLEEEFSDFLIPKHTWVMANIWHVACTLLVLFSNLLHKYRAITHNANTYPEPHMFSPERFLPLNGTESQLDPMLFVFGFGRRYVLNYIAGCNPWHGLTIYRRCPGLHLADRFVYLVIARLLAVFKFQPFDESELNETSDFKSGLISWVWFLIYIFNYSQYCQLSAPKPFVCKIIRRGGPNTIFDWCWLNIGL